MAGQPKRQAMIDALERRTLEYFEVDPVDVAIGTQDQPTTLDYVCAYIESGKTLQSLADELNVSRPWLTGYLDKAFGDAAAARLTEARSRASHSIAESALGISDEKVVDAADASRNGLRVRARQWTAERWNKQAYGQSRDVNVSLSITTLHIDALRANPAGLVTGTAPVAIQALPPASE